MKDLTRLIIIDAQASLKRFAFLGILSFLSFFASAQLHADFTATPATGCAPLVVNFSDFSSGNPSYWKWDLGNGTTSVLQNPSATYFNPGQYSIKLIVKNSQGADSIIKSRLINVYASPLVDFSANQQSGCIPLVTKFTDETGGSITAWEWDFGDGEFSTNQNPVHSYTASGTYNVSLRATNNFGCVSSTTKPNYIEVYSGVKAAFTNTVPATCNQPATINFTNSSAGIGILSYAWNFGDGATSIVANPSHTYNVGTYDVSLVVFNSNGCSDTLIKHNLITLQNVKADFSAATMVCQSSNVNFVNTSAPLPSGASWNFGDGTTSNSINPVKIFASAGNFNVKMIAGFGGCKDSVTKPIQVLAKPGVNFTANSTTSCSAPFTVNFANVTSAGNAFSWDFGDGSSSNLGNPSHTYMKEGFYTVKLAFTNNSGCTDSLVKTDFIQIKSPVAAINNLPQKGCGPLTHSFSANINSIDSVISYKWDFGDGSTSVSVSPTHTYTNSGAYTVSLFYSTASGCTDTAKFINGILVGSKPVVNFSAAPRDVCASTTVNFTDMSTGNPDEWLWLFGDGSSSVVKNPEHVYSDTGYFSITLIALNKGCADTLILPEYIHIKPPIALFDHITSCNQPGHVVFTDKSIGADSWKWLFGDGTSSSVENPTHDYTVSGSYTVQLTVVNNTTGCDYTKVDTVNVFKEIADFNTSVTSACKNAPVIFNAINSIPGNISSYTWRFGDGITISGTSNTINHTYVAAGTYGVTMILKTKDGCSDSIVKPLAMQVDGPTAIFKTVNPGACQNSAVMFIDSSYANGAHSVIQWQWNWGDGVTQTLSAQPFQHTYATAGNYSVSLKVTEDNGCTDSVIHLNTVIISKPVAGFKGDTLSCTLTNVGFTNLSSGPSLKYVWNFGDGTTSTQANPLHNYSAEGIYTVSLSVTDLYGCTDFNSKTNYVRIADPKADFRVSDTVGTCPPLIVNFTNASRNYSYLSWDFGDGTSSTSLNPSHFYATPGLFNAVLTIKGAGGCTDQKSVQILVKGPKGSFTYTNISGCKPLQTNFKATTGKNINFVWDFSDGNTIQTPDSIVTHTYRTAGIYLPKMILVDSSGCKVPITGNDSIKVYEVIASFTNPTSAFCDSAKVLFTNTSTGNDAITSWLWNFGDKSTSTLSDPVHNYSKTGNYNATLFITSENGCKDSITVNTAVKIVNSPKIAIGGNPGACTPALLTFTGIISVPDTSVLNWQWDFANGNVSTLQNPPAQTFLNAGSYSVRLIAVNSSGCPDTAIKVATAYPLPDLQITKDTTICVGASFNLRATDAQTYSWSPANYLSCSNCATPLARPDSAIKYFLKGTSNKGCLSTDSVYVDVKFPNTVKVNGPDTLCIGSSVQLTATGAEAYSWSPSAGLDNPSKASPVAAPRTTTIYTVTGSDTKGCFTSTASLPVNVYPIPVVTAGGDQTISAGRSLDIIPKISPDVIGVLWTPSTGVVARNYPGITVLPPETTEYTILVKNEGGCFARDKITVFVTCDNTNIFVPNTFSPNGDGINDIFYPRGSGVFRVINLLIFNRWGEVVFEKGNFNANDPSSGWDGTYKGKKLSPDVFVYSLEVLCSNNQSLVFKGNVALIK